MTQTILSLYVLQWPDGKYYVNSEERTEHLEQAKIFKQLGHAKSAITMCQHSNEYNKHTMFYITNWVPPQILHLNVSSISTI